MIKTRYLIPVGVFMLTLFCGINAFASSTNLQGTTTNAAESATVDQMATADDQSVVTDFDTKKLKNIGIELDDHTKPAKVEKQAAIDAASNAFPQWAHDATSIKVEYHLVSNPYFNGFSPQALEKNGDLKEKGHMDKLPAYLVIFRGMSYAGNAPANSHSEAPIHHEYTVVVDATTGEPLMGFSYR